MGVGMPQKVMDGNVWTAEFIMKHIFHHIKQNSQLYFKANINPHKVIPMEISVEEKFEALLILSQLGL